MGPAGVHHVPNLAARPVAVLCVPAHVRIVVLL